MTDVSVQYNLEGKSTRALDKATLDLHPSTVLGIVGESGSGKTTLGMSLLGLIEPPGKVTEGKIEYCGRDVLSMSERELRKYRWQEVSMVYQSAMNSLNPVKPVIHPIVEVLRFHKHVSKKEAIETALKLLSGVGLKPDRAFDYPHEMSGGMRQRVIIALAIALSPKILIADEPTSALDVVIQKQILSLLKKQITEKNLTLIFITHEISLLNGLVDDVAVMYAGEIVEKGPLEKILLEPKHPYTEMLVGTLLTLDSELADVRNLTKGDMMKSSYLLPTSGCKYTNRCKYAFSRCQVERPKLLPTAPGRSVACHKYN